MVGVGFCRHREVAAVAVTVEEAAETAGALPIARPRALAWGRYVPRIFGMVMWIVAIVSGIAAFGHIFRTGVQPIRETIDALIIPAPANIAYAVFLAALLGGVLDADEARAFEGTELAELNK